MAKIQLSMPIYRLKGKLGNYYIVETRRGPVLRSRPTYRRHVSEDQREAITRLQKVARLWTDVSPEEVAQWNVYGESLARCDSFTGDVAAPTGYNLFVGLGAKILQIDSEAVVPSAPPTGTSVEWEFEVSADLADVDGEAAIRFTAAGVNSPGVATELLIQRLPSRNRTPKKAYKAAAFVTFTSEEPIASVPIIPYGYYATAYRFVRRTTGQMTQLYRIAGVIEGADFNRTAA